MAKDLFKSKTPQCFFGFFVGHLRLSLSANSSTMLYLSLGILNYIISLACFTACSCSAKMSVFSSCKIKSATVLTWAFYLTEVRWWKWCWVWMSLWANCINISTYVWCTTPAGMNMCRKNPSRCSHGLFRWKIKTGKQPTGIFTILHFLVWVVLDLMEV